jgi:hypothetical protein
MRADADFSVAWVAASLVLRVGGDLDVRPLLLVLDRARDQLGFALLVRLEDEDENVVVLRLLDWHEELADARRLRCVVLVDGHDDTQIDRVVVRHLD